MIDQGYFERLGSQFGAHERQCISRGIDANGVHSEPTQLSCENLAIGAVIIDHQDSLTAYGGTIAAPARAARQLKRRSVP